MEVKNYLMIMLCTFLYVGTASAQETTTAFKNEVTEQASESAEMVSHKVMMGENIMLICRKYKVKPNDIYEFNPSAAQGIAANQTLQIPMHKALGKKQPKKSNSILESAAAAGNLYAARSSASIEKENQGEE